MGGQFHVDLAVTAEAQNAVVRIFALFVCLFVYFLFQIYYIINIIYTEIPVQHSWFKWRSVRNNMSK